MPLNAEQLFDALPAKLEADLALNAINGDELPQIVPMLWPKDVPSIQKIWTQRGDMRPLDANDNFVIQNTSFEVMTAQQGKRLAYGIKFKDEEIANLTAEHLGAPARRQREQVEAALRVLNAFKITSMIKMCKLADTKTFLTAAPRDTITTAEMSTPAVVTDKLTKLIVNFKKTYFDTNNVALFVTPELYTSLVKDDVLVDSTKGNAGNGGLASGFVKELMGVPVYSLNRLPANAIAGANKAEYTYIKDIDAQFELTSDEEKVCAIMADLSVFEVMYNEDIIDTPNVKYVSYGPINVLYQGGAGGNTVPSLTVVAQMRLTAKIYETRGAFITVA